MVSAASFQIVVDTAASLCRRRLQALAVVAAAMVAVVYILVVRTGGGQRLDATALQGRRALDPRAVHAAARLLTTIDVASLALDVSRWVRERSSPGQS